MKTKNKVAIVTGAARGIGKEIALSLASQGFAVAVADIASAKAIGVVEQIKQEGGKSLNITVDLRKEKSIKLMIDKVIKMFGRLDLVVNNARPKLNLLPYAQSLHEWGTALDVLLTAPALIAKYSISHLQKSKGNIINIVSTNAYHISHQPAAYHVAKAGLVQLTKYLAFELGHLGIRVNAVCPGLVDLYDDDKPLSGKPINKKIIESIVPLGRAAEAEEIAKAALFLASDDAAYITGHILMVEGGITLGDQFHAVRKTIK